jgi:hypothetical protein
MALIKLHKTNEAELDVGVLIITTDQVGAITAGPNAAGLQMGSRWVRDTPDEVTAPAKQLDDRLAAKRRPCSPPIRALERKRCFVTKLQATGRSYCMCAPTLLSSLTKCRCYFQLVMASIQLESL